MKTAATGTYTTTTKSIVSSTNATPIVVTSTAHGLSNGDYVWIVGHTTNTNANGQWTVANKTADTFELTGSVGNGVGGATGTILKLTETDLNSPATPGLYAVKADVNSLAGGDVLECYCYGKMVASGTERLLDFDAVYGAQTYGAWFPFDGIPNDLTESGALRFSFRQTRGVALTIPWSVIRLDVTDIETDTQDIQNRLPAALTGAGNIKAEAIAISSSAVQAIWDAATSALTTVGSIGKKLADWVVGTIDTYTGNTKQTGDAYARLGASGAGLTALGDTRIANLDATVSSRLASTSYTAPPSAATIAAQIFSTEISGLTVTEQLRLQAALSGGKSSGFVAGSACTVTFRDPDDTKDVVVAVLDANGNRTSLTLDLT